ncbi:hypothetical protein [Ensifer aridi]|uniref:hypothetical protein n=1 Tax=Ensifer aridi TaxID=1708715 RepID=UPI00047C3162|nr:hypothetical protein [Ensifer aridi]
MKMPQRSFVVEFKSGRRRPTARANSIWGDTDFKALAREVEQKAPHLFGSDEMRSSGAAAPAEPIDAASAYEHAGESEVAAAAVVSSADTGVDLPIQAVAERETVEPGDQGPASEPLPNPRALRSTARRAVRRAPLRTKSSMEAEKDRIVESAAVEHRISLEELAALEADNKRLKRLLAEQLRSQNVQLKTMLARFDTA